MSDELFEPGERIAGLAAGINIATFDMLTLVADFDRREGWADNFASCAEWLAWRTGRTPAAVRENVRVAHALEELPLTATAMKRGRLSYTKVRTMTRVATRETEATLLEYAQSTSAARLEWLVRGWKRLSRDGELAAEEARRQSRTFSVAVDADGMYVVRGRLEPEVGAVLMRAIEAASDALYRGEDADRRPRNRQRRADAAGLVAERALAAAHHVDGGETSPANTVLLCRRHHRLVHEGRTRMAMDRDGKAAFFTRAGQVLGSAPPLPEAAGNLPEPPPPPLDRLSNGAPRFVDSAVPLSLELAALEAVA